MKADTREPGKWLGDVKNMYFSIEIFRVLISKCTKKGLPTIKSYDVQRWTAALYT